MQPKQWVTIEEKASWSFFKGIAFLWLAIALVLAFAGISLLVSHTAFMSAFHHNSIEKKTAELMWRNYCAKPLHEVPSAQEIEQTMQRPLNCEWALATKDMDLVEQSLVDSNVQPLFHFSRLHLKRPWLAIAIMTSLYLASLVVPALAAFYYFREVRRRCELIQKSLNSEATIAQKVSLSKLLGRS